MMSFFGGGSRVKAPAIQEAPPVPTEGGKQVKRKSDDIRRKMLAKLGREGTILTGLGGPQQVFGGIGV
jgi:hypothetical protein